MKIFSGSSNLPLAKKITKNQLGDIYLHDFPSKEKYCQFKTNIRGEDVFLIQGVGMGSSNDNLMELLVMTDAAKRASADRITAVIPMSFYCRQDRKDKSRTPISAKLTMNILTASGVDRILTMDLHSQQISGFTDLPLDQLTFEPILAQYIQSKYHSLALRDSVVIVSPDEGGIKRGSQLAKRLRTKFAFINKERTGDETVEINSFVGDVNNKTAIIVDDMTESAGTLIQAAEECKRRGATKVICAVTHACFTETAMERLSDAMPFPNRTEKPHIIDEFIHSDTVHTWWHLKYKPANIVELSVAELFATAINNISNNKSVSELF